MNYHRQNLIVVSLFTLACLLCFQGAARAQYTILHNFAGGTDGRDCDAGLVQGNDGNFYGTTRRGGTSLNSGVGYGTIFQMNPSGAVTIVRAFIATSSDGGTPFAPFIKTSDGNFYGTTYEGGAGECGIVFNITPYPPGTFTIIHSFLNSGNNGISPQGAVALDPLGNLYGTTSNAGTYGGGTIFTLQSGSLAYLHFFGDPGVTFDGTAPEADLIRGSDGNFYGTTRNGGTSGNYGTVFKITPDGITYTVLHRFNDGTVINDGRNPVAGLVQASDGYLYGTTLIGGSSGFGTIFRISQSGAYTILHNFTGGAVGGDGSGPRASLIQGPDGKLYGTTSGGGAGGLSFPSSSGIVFSITTAGVMTIFHSFHDGTVTNDGNTPMGALVFGTDGSIYGTTAAGGFSNLGTIFKLTLPPPSTDSPAMPAWAMVFLALLVVLTASRFIPSVRGS